MKEEMREEITKVGFIFVGTEIGKSFLDLKKNL